MRDIEFRGKSAESGKWIIGDYHKALGDMNIILPRNERVEYKVKVIAGTVDQYTGLKDKNGAKIFEGDIILSNGEKSRYEVKIGEFSPFLFNAFLKEMELMADYKIIGVYAKSLDNKDIVGEECFIPIPNKIEVIGNIHDNPELLEVNYEGLQGV